MKKTMVGSMSEWSGVLRDLFRQINDGSLRFEQLQAVVEHRNPFEKPDYITDWRNFYKEVFGIDVDLSKVKIPEKKKGFNRLIIVAKGMTSQKLYDKCKELFPSWKWTGRDLDEIGDPDRSERSPEKKSYAIWIRDRVEADRELKNLSANDLGERKNSGITLEERLLFELKYFKETGKHLDIKNITLCSGSRCSDGSVPFVGWSGCYGRLGVDWCYPGSAGSFLRSREAVS